MIIIKDKIINSIIIKKVIQMEATIKNSINQEIVDSIIIIIIIIGNSIIIIIKIIIGVKITLMLKIIIEIKKSVTSVGAQIITMSKKIMNQIGKIAIKKIMKAMIIGEKKNNIKEFY